MTARSRRSEHDDLSPKTLANHLTLLITMMNPVHEGHQAPNIQRCAAYPTERSRSPPTNDVQNDSPSRGATTKVAPSGMPTRRPRAKRT